MTFNANMTHDNT